MVDRHSDKVHKKSNSLKMFNIMRNSLIVEKSKNTPYVILDIEKGYLEISGRSMPENPREFYDRIFDFIKYSKINSLTSKIDLDYINSTSSKCIYNLVFYLKEKVENIDIEWYYDLEDEDMAECIEDVRDSSGVKITLMKK